MDIFAFQQGVKFGEPVWHDQAYTHPQLREIRQKDFYGRHEAVNRAKRTIQFSARAVIFVGERRAGKTSILKRVLNTLQNDSKYIIIEIPWLEVHSASELMRAILAKACDILDITEPAVFDTIEKINTLTEFRHLLQLILKTIPGRTVVIGIDEFDSILSEISSSEKNEIISTIILLIEADESPVKIILTMTCEPASLEAGYSSPLTTKSEKIRLEPFTKSEMDEMLLGILENKIPISEQEQKEIFELSGGWPYFAKALLYYWIELTNNTDAMILAKEKAIRDTGLGDTLKHIYQKHMTTSERTVLLVITKVGGRLTAKDKTVLDVSIRAAAQELIKRSYLAEEDDSYVFRIAMLPDWFTRWTQFDEQFQHYASEILTAIERKKDPWAGISQSDIFDGIADEER